MTGNFIQGTQTEQRMAKKLYEPKEFIFSKIHLYI